MKIKHFLPLSILTVISLTSCAGNPNAPKVLKNGELFGLQEITYENAFVTATFDYMDTMIQSGEPFIFYLTSSECYHCYLFKEKILSYVRSTNNLVAMMDIYDDEKESYSEDFEKFKDKYEDYFFINGEAYTPQIYIVEGLKFETQVPNSRYDNEGMFKRAMQDYVNQCNVYSFSTVGRLNNFLSSNPNSLTVLIDRKQSELMSTYHGYVQDLIKARNNKIALFEIDDSNRTQIFEKFGLTELTAPTGFITKQSQLYKYKFINNKESNEIFLNENL